MKRSILSTLGFLALGFAGIGGATEITLDSRMFQPIDVSTRWAESSGGSLICTAGVATFAAQIRLPRDSTLKQIAMWGGDSSPSQDASVILARICQPEFIAASPTFTNISQIGSSGSSGAYFDSAVLNEQAFSTNTCTYSVVATLGQTCTTNLSIAKVRIRYTDDAIFANGFD